jgi:hypothetical protein
MSHPVIRKLVFDIVKEIDYDLWTDVYPTGEDSLVDFKRTQIRRIEQITIRAIRELTDMDFDND